ncbi:MAG: hypothetical protein JWO05_1229 [Gemmatimonadetes bacterium]|nr:hypothetical protein [Gemmatimonadota bacterium]
MSRVSRWGIALTLAASVSCGGRTPATGASPASPAGALDLQRPLSGEERAWVDRTLSGLSLHDRVAQLVMVWVLGDYTSNGDSSYAEARRWIEVDHVGGVLMSLGTPIEIAAKINHMQSLSLVPLLTATDLEPGLGRLEGGLFTHYLLETGGGTVFAPQMAIAATGRDDDAYDVGRAIAEEARAVGIQVNFAPDVDVNNNPANPVINVRSFGEQPQRVARLASRFIRGTLDGGAMPVAKHFPGHGDTDVDSHAGLPVVASDRARLDTVELVPFRAAIAAGAGGVMSAHIALPAIQGDKTPATLAPLIISGLLRDSLHFAGLTFTDAMSMEGVGQGYTVEKSSVLAIQAGDDILLKPTDPSRAIAAIVSAVEQGAISRERIDSAVRKVLELKVRVGAVSHPQADLSRLRDVVGSPAHRALSADIAQRALTLLRDRDRLVPFSGGRTVLVQYMPETELKAGRALAAILRAADRTTSVVKISPATSAAQLDSIARASHGADRIVIATYVRRVEGEGRAAIPLPVAAWIDSLAAQEKVVVAAFGNPYLLRQFPRVQGYLVAYGVSDVLERAVGAALLGRSPINGHVPVSLPGFFRAGDGEKR